MKTIEDENLNKFWDKDLLIGQRWIMDMPVICIN